MNGAHDTMEQLIAAHALGSIEPAGFGEVGETEREILDHIAGCEPCRSLYLEMRETAADLALAAPAMPVPPELEGKILAQIRGEGNEVKRHRSSISVRYASVAAAIMLVFAGSMAAFAVQVSGRLSREERRSASVRSALALVGRPGTKTATLAGRGGTLVLAYTPSGEAMIFGTNVPAVAKGKKLELWLIRGGVPQPVAFFTPDGGVVAAPVKIQPARQDTIAVTVEPKFVTKPSGSPVSAVVLV
ncbi:MAG: hypothetical protein NVSMB57_02520 [Actinomycetota bacterium]